MSRQQVATSGLADSAVTSLKIADGTVAAADLANGAATNAKLASDTARANLLTNGSFDVWSRGAGPFTVLGSYCADRWVVNQAGTDTFSVAKHTTAANLDTGSQAAAACTFVLGTGAGGSQIFQHLVLNDGNQLAGRTLTLSVRVKCSTANAVRVAINNYYSATGHYTYSTFHSGGGSYETLTVTASIDPTATFVQSAIFFAASCTAYLDNAMLVVGSVAADYAPLHPADDLARCLRYYQRWDGSYTAIGSSQSTTAHFALLPHQAKFGLTPTLTSSPVANLLVLTSTLGASVAPNSVALSGGTLNSSLLQLGTAAAFNAAGAPVYLHCNTGWVALESNP